MDHFNLAQSFIEQCERAANTKDLSVAFQRAMEILGFRYFACCSHVDPLNPPRGAVVLHTYPAEWARHFSERQLFYIDPVLLHAERTLSPFFWDASKFRSGVTSQQGKILAQASQFGITHGFTVPIHSPCSLGVFRASCSVVPDSERIAPESYCAVHLMACYLYESASRHAGVHVVPASRELPRRERQCLELVAQGKSDWVVGQLLGIGESTVHNHIERAKRRLGVATRVQAIVQALVNRQISFGDVIRSESSKGSDS